MIVYEENNHSKLLKQNNLIVLMSFHHDKEHGFIRSVRKCYALYLQQIVQLVMQLVAPGTKMYGTKFMMLLDHIPTKC